MNKLVLILAAVSFAVPAAAQSGGEKSVRAFFAEGDAAWGKLDFKKLASQFAPDAVLLRSDGTVVKGRKAIGKSLSGGFAKPGLKVKTTPTLYRWIDKKHVLVDVDIEISMPKSGKPPMKFHGVHLLFKKGRNWLIKDSRGYTFSKPRPPPKK